MTENTVADETRDEVVLSAGLVSRLEGRFTFEPSSGEDSQPRLVDVARTNERLVLVSTSLERFTTIRPDDTRLLRAADVIKQPDRLDPRDIVWLMLCGGMSFRTGGEIHPLKRLDDRDE